jgi:hypothetical protein
MVQIEDSSYFLPLETSFQMVNGSIIRGSGGNGTSNNPLQENGPLTFDTRRNITNAAWNQSYCIMVSTEKLVFFL